MVDERVIAIPPIPTWFKVILLVILVSSVSIGYTEIRIGMEKDNSFVRYFFAESRIKVTYRDGNWNYIELGRIDTLLNVNDLTGKSRLEIKFLNTNLGLSANFSKVELFLCFEYQLYLKYSSIVGRFLINEHSDVLRKNDFILSTEGMMVYYGSITITSYLWQADVPDIIESNLIFIEA